MPPRWSSLKHCSPRSSALRYGKVGEMHTERRFSPLSKRLVSGMSSLESGTALGTRVPVVGLSRLLPSSSPSPMSASVSEPVELDSLVVIIACAYGTGSGVQARKPNSLSVAPSMSLGGRKVEYATNV
eukprot:4421891-Amphidinium_carterae.2